MRWLFYRIKFRYSEREKNSPIGRSNKKVNEVSIVDVCACAFQILHQHLRDTESPIQRCHCHGAHVSVPKTTPPLALPEHVTHDRIVRGLGDGKKFGPTGHVLEVEGHVECFGEDIEVDIVEAKEIVHVELSCGSHSDALSER